MPKSPQMPFWITFSCGLSLLPLGCGTPDASAPDEPPIFEPAPEPEEVVGCDGAQF